VEQASSQVLVVGYGNIHRRDDGIGPWVVNWVGHVLQHRKEIRTLSLHQLDADLIEELRDIDLLILVDASVEEIEGGWRWMKVEPEFGDLPYLTHHVKPSFLLGLLQSIYHRCPQTWLVSVHGQDFGFGEMLSQEAEERACGVVSEIVRFLSRE